MKALQIKRILFATDFLESSRLALDYAVAFAHHFKATVILLHAVELLPPAQEAEVVTGHASVSREMAYARLRAFAAGLKRTGLAVETRVEEGSPCRAVAEAVEALSPDLLVLGVHGRHRGLGHLLLGSNTEKILLTVDCPILSVGAHVLAGLDLHLPVKEILYCSDLSPHAAAAAPYALFLSREFAVPVDLCHLAPSPANGDMSSIAELAEGYCAALRRTVPEVAEEWCTPAFQLRHALSLGEVLKRAEEASASLIVLGVHGESQLGRHLHTNFAYQLLTRAVCLVLTIRAGPAYS